MVDKEIQNIHGNTPLEDLYRSFSPTRSSVYHASNVPRRRPPTRLHPEASVPVHGRPVPLAPRASRRSRRILPRPKAPTRVRLNFDFTMSVHETRRSCSRVSSSKAAFFFLMLAAFGTLAWSYTWSITMRAWQKLMHALHGFDHGAQVLEHTTDRHRVAELGERRVDVVHALGGQASGRRHGLRLRVAVALRVRDGLFFVAGRSDAPDGAITKITYPDGQPMVMHMPTDLVDNRTWLDKGLTALYAEQMRMGQLWNALNKYVTDWAAPLITIHGGHIDGIFYTSKLMDEEMIDDDLRQFTLTNGEPAFQIKRDSKHVIPRLPQEVTKPKDMLLSSGGRPSDIIEPVWRRCTETQFQQDPLERDAHLLSVAQHIVQNGGATLTGPAGVGKTVLVNVVKDLILAEDENAQIVVAALTHVAARLVQGSSTVAHILHKHATMTDGWFFLDEISMIPLSMWGDISRWQLMGNRFILVGGFDGQLQPIFDRWGDVAKRTDLSSSTLIHNMCNGLHAQLTEYRRGVDPELFANYFGLHPRLQDDIEQLVAEMRGKYTLGRHYRARPLPCHISQHARPCQRLAEQTEVERSDVDSGEGGNRRQSRGMQVRATGHETLARHCPDWVHRLKLPFWNRAQRDIRGG